MSMKDVLEKAENVEPIARVNGIDVMTFTEANAKTQADMVEGRPDLGVHKMNPDGTLARSNTYYAGVNVERLFQNRYRYIEESDDSGNMKKKLQVVVDHRACDEQASGKVYLGIIPAYVISRGYQKKLRIERVDSILREDFIKNFTRKLDREAMNDILPLIADRVTDVTTDSLSI